MSRQNEAILHCLAVVNALTTTAQADLTAFLECLGYQLTDIMRPTLFFKKCPMPAG
jgi:hypothetical protein